MNLALYLDIYCAQTLTHAHKHGNVFNKLSLDNRIEGSQLEDRTIDKMWLVRHLELIRQNMVGDLRVVKVHQ